MMMEEAAKTWETTQSESKNHNGQNPGVVVSAHNVTKGAFYDTDE